ncbi:DUF6049 family protein [Saccharopolyspora taberi]|uniref:DUF6049 family protein n=1 Tax=Saccharopolyspora taberi TaxID=60895 RepID=A0ABN3VP50_9PSEU
MRFLLAAVVAVLMLGAIALPPAASAQPAAQQTLLEVSKITPAVVEGGAPGEVTVTGTLTNTGDRRIDDVEARIQRGNPVSTESAAQQAIRETPSTVTDPNFTPIIDSLAPGQRLPFELRVPFNGPNSLQISSPGVYPLLVNINGKPGSGGRARIAEEHFLLPVLATPGAAPVRPPKPTPSTLVIPVVDYPRMTRGGGPGSRPVLIDDLLSASLAPGGRLYELVQAVEDGAGPGSPLGSALCFAVDPDLLATVEAMQGGYDVQQPNGGAVEGIGSGAARLWLGKLRSAVSGRCVIPLPYSDADVVALGRAGLPDLIKGSLEGSSLLIADLLGVEPRKDVLWPIEGALDQPAAGQLAGTGITTTLLRPEALGGPAPAKVRGSNLTALTVDPLAASALDPLRDTPRETTEMSPPVGGSARTQDALGALAFRASNAPAGHSVITPPRRWNVRGDDVRGLLSGMQQLTAAGFLQPTALSEAGGAALPEADLSYPVESAAREIPRRVLDELARENFKVGDLFLSSDVERSVNIAPAEVTNPLRDALLRGASSAWRGNPEAARFWVGNGARTLSGQLSRVRLEEGNTKIALSEAQAHIPLTVSNELPIQVSIAFRIPHTPGIITRDLGVLRIPAQGRRTFYVPTEVQRSGTFSVDVHVTTPAGTELGPPQRMRFDAGTYGPVTMVITIVAAALLIVLSSLRILRRLRNRIRRNRAAAQPPAIESEATPLTTTDSDRGSS